MGARFKMSGEVAKPPVAKHWAAHGPNATHYGTTDIDQVTTTGQPNFEYFDDEQGQLSTLSGLSFIPPMPEEGDTVDEGAIYDYSGDLYKARQSHTRTSHDPSTIPALFSTIRSPGNLMDWIVGEQVFVGDRRDYSGISYECIQSHQTQANWTPDVTSALWSVFTQPQAGEWAPRLDVAVDDELDYLSKTYVCIQAHTTQVGWEPTNTLGTLWSLLSGGSEWAIGVAYSVDDEVTYQGNSYRCLQAHTSIAPWTPPAVPALWQSI